MRTPGKLSIRIRDRNITSGVEKNVSLTNWPIAIFVPAPPFAFGETVALATNTEISNYIVTACNCHDALVAALELLSKIGKEGMQPDYLAQIADKALTLVKSQEAPE